MGASLETNWVFQYEETQITRRAVEIQIKICSAMAKLEKVTAKTLLYSSIMNLVQTWTDPHLFVILTGLDRVDMTRRFYATVSTVK